MRAEHQRQGAANVTVRNVITSLRVMATFDWREFFESVSLVDRILRAESEFGAMDFATRDRYRKAIEDLARGSEPARSRWPARPSRWSAPTPGVEDPGLLPDLRRAPAPGGDARLSRLGVRQHLIRAYVASATWSYLGSIAIVTRSSSACPSSTRRSRGCAYRRSSRCSPLLAFFPASDAAIALVNRAVMEAFPPRPLPRLALRARGAARAQDPGGGAHPARPTRRRSPSRCAGSASTISPTPTAQLSLRHPLGLDRCRRAEPRPATRRLLAAARAGIDELNRQHGPADDGEPRFYLLPSPPRLERERGALDRLGAQARQAPRAESAAARRHRHDVHRRRRRVAVRSRGRPLRDHARCRHPAAAGRGGAPGGHARPSAQPAPPRSRASDGSSRGTASSSRASRRPCPPSARARSSSASRRARRASTPTPPRCRTSIRISSARARTRARASTTWTPSRPALAGRVPEGALLSHDLFEGLLRAGGAGHATSSSSRSSPRATRSRPRASTAGRAATGSSCRGCSAARRARGRRARGISSDRPLEDARQPAADPLRARAPTSPCSSRWTLAGRRVRWSGPSSSCSPSRCPRSFPVSTDMLPQRPGISKRVYLRSPRREPRAGRRPGRAHPHPARPPGLADGRRHRPDPAAAPDHAPPAARVGLRRPGEVELEPRPRPACTRAWRARSTLAVIAGVVAAFGPGTPGPSPSRFVALWLLSPAVARWISLPPRARRPPSSCAPEERRGPARRRAAELALLRDVRGRRGQRAAARQLPGGSAARGGPPDFAHQHGALPALDGVRARSRLDRHPRHGRPARRPPWPTHGAARALPRALLQLVRHEQPAAARAPLRLHRRQRQSRRPPARARHRGAGADAARPSWTGGRRPGSRTRSARRRGRAPPAQGGGCPRARRLQTTVDGAARHARPEPDTAPAWAGRLRELAAGRRRARPSWRTGSTRTRRADASPGSRRSRRRSPSIGATSTRSRPGRRRSTRLVASAAGGRSPDLPAAARLLGADPRARRDAGARRGGRPRAGRPHRGRGARPGTPRLDRWPRRRRRSRPSSASALAGEAARPAVSEDAGRAPRVSSSRRWTSRSSSTRPASSSPSAIGRRWRRSTRGATTCWPRRRA